ncbi:MAG: adenylate/guanylate cyclase domain-containing protein, partial [Bradyrhizobium sp.]
IAVAALLVVIATIIVFRYIAMLAAPKIAIAFAGGETVQAAIGPTLLETIRSNNLSHQSECGGRARCGLCRVRLDQGADTLPPPAPEERTALARLGASDHVRLACQIRPTAPMTVTRLVGGDEGAREAAANVDTQGERRVVCLVHVSVRAFATLSRDRLPYDLVFMMNEIFGAVGLAVEGHAGRIDRFFGDGVLAAFGEQHGPDQGCRDALQAIRAMDLAMDRVNEKIAAEIGQPVELAIGAWAGEVVAGRLELGRRAQLAVLGLGFEPPARLAELANARGWQLALSGDVATRAGLRDIAGVQRERLAGAGQGADIDVIGLPRARDVSLDAGAGPAASV